MESIEQLFARLHSRGVAIWVENNRLRVRAAKGSLHPKELEALRASKQRVIQLIQGNGCEEAGPLKPRDKNAPIPLTSFQRVFWSAIVKQPVPVSARECVSAFRILGHIDVPLLEYCLRVLVQRHAALRTRILTNDHIPVQHIDPDSESALEVMNAEGIDPSTGQTRENLLSARFVEKTVDLSRGPLFRALLLHRSKDEHVLLFSLHQLVSDALSNIILGRELWTLYSQGEQQAPFSLPHLSLQFADYAVWQDKIRPLWRETHEAYWQQQVQDGSLARMPLHEGAATSFQGAVYEFTLCGALSEKLRALARREHTYLAFVILTLYVVVMFRWCSQSTLIVTCLENGRHEPGLVHTVGFLSRLLLLRIDRRQGESFRELLRRVMQLFDVARSHGDFTQVSFLQAALLRPIWDFHFNWLPSYWEQMSVPNLRDIVVQPFPQPFPIKAAIRPRNFLPHFLDTPSGIRGVVAYRPDLVGEKHLVQFEHHLTVAAEAFTRDWESYPQTLDIRLEG